MPAIVTKTSAATGISGITETPVIVMMPDSAGLNVICTMPSLFQSQLRICVSPRKTWYGFHKSSCGISTVTKCSPS